MSVWLQLVVSNIFVAGLIALLAWQVGRSGRQSNPCAHFVARFFHQADHATDCVDAHQCAGGLVSSGTCLYQHLSLSRVNLRAPRQCLYSARDSKCFVNACRDYKRYERQCVDAKLPPLDLPQLSLVFWICDHPCSRHDSFPAIPSTLAARRDT